MVIVRVLAGGLAIGRLYFVFHTGDLGAKAVWQGRVSRRFGGGPGPGPGGGGGVSGLFTPGGG
jgi:hypothetical protein